MAAVKNENDVLLATVVREGGHHARVGHQREIGGDIAYRNAPSIDSEEVETVVRPEPGFRHPMTSHVLTVRATARPNRVSVPPIALLRSTPIRRFSSLTFIAGSFRPLKSNPSHHPAVPDQNSTARRSSLISEGHFLMSGGIDCGGPVGAPPVEGFDGLPC